MVLPIKEEETTKSGIILPKNTNKINNKGKVVQIGVKAKIIQVGDLVMYHDNVGTPINFKGVDYILLKEDSEIISKL